MGAITPIVIGVAVVVLAVFGLVYLWARSRSERRRQARLDIAFERAQAVRTRGSGLQGSPYSLYAEPVWQMSRRERRDR